MQVQPYLQSLNSNKIDVYFPLSPCLEISLFEIIDKQYIIYNIDISIVYE